MVADRKEQASGLKNLGPVSRGWLAELGLHTLADLVSWGPAVAYHRIKQRHAAASLNLLYALEACIQGKDWRALDEASKARLREELTRL